MRTLANILTAAALGLCGAAAVSNVAAAKDAVRVDVDDADGAVTIDENGAFQTPGTYAIGTIKLWYQIVGTQFPADSVIKSPRLCLYVVGGKPKPATKYPADVYFDQVGTPDVNLDVTPADVLTFVAGDVDVAEENEEHCVYVEISVPASIAGDPAYQVPGTQLVANLQLSTDSGAHLDTVTTVKFYLTLVEPSEPDGACITPLHLISDDGLTAELGPISLTYNVNSENLDEHKAQHVVALVNTCDTEVTFDLNTDKNENFDWQSADAVKTTTTNQEFVDLADLLGDLSGLSLAAQAGTPLCFDGVTVPGHQTFVVAERVALAKGSAKFPGTHQPTGRALGAWFYDNFLYEAFVDDTAACDMTTASPDVDPDSGELQIDISQVSYQGGSNPPATEYPPAP